MAAKPAQSLTLPTTDGIRLMAIADVPVGWRRAPLLGLASAQLAFFVGWTTTSLWLGACLALELAVFYLCRRVAADDRRWRRPYIGAALALPWCWISYAILLWIGAPPAMHISAVCALFIASMYIVLCNHYDRRIMLGLMAPPAGVLFVMLLIELFGVLPWYVLPLSILNAVGMVAILFQAAGLMHRSNSGLRNAQAELIAERDLLDQRVRERTAELALATQRAQAASLAKSQFIANMSHELRTPLNAVIGYSEMLAEDLQDAGLDNAGADAERIRDSGQHLLGLIDDILDLAKADSNQLKIYWAMTNVQDVLTRAVEAARAAAQANGNRIERRISPTLAPMMSDEKRLKQAVGNLLSNACKFTSDGLITLSAEMVGDDLVVSVRDTGVGVSEEAQRRLFQPFVQADASLTRRADGAGLGLVNARNIARLMGGDVTVQSELGRGSAFTLRLPRAAPAAAVQAA